MLIRDDPLTTEQRLDLLELLDGPCGQRSTLVSSQMSVDNWLELIGDPTLVDAILNWLVRTVAYSISRENRYASGRRN